MLGRFLQSVYLCAFETSMTAHELFLTCVHTYVQPKNCIQWVIPKNFCMAEPRKVQALCSTDETNEAGFRVDHRSIGTVLHMCGGCSASGPNASIRRFDGDMYIPGASPHVPPLWSLFAQVFDARAMRRQTWLQVDEGINPNSTSSDTV